MAVFSSYDFLENLIGCQIHSATRVVPEWQTVAAGDAVNLAPGIGLTVVEADPGHSLVLRGAPVLAGRSAPYDFTWAFVLQDGPDGTSRLIVRERYQYTHRWAALIVRPVQPISALMSSKMLLNIRDNANAAP